MKKSNTILGVIFSIFLISCGSSIESDADKVAKLICEASNDISKSAEANDEAEKISNKYEGEEKSKFEMLVLQKSKDCLPSGSSISSDNSSSNDKVSYSSEDIDEMLDSYEDYMNEYMNYLKKMKNNDMSAMSDLPALMEKGEEWSKKSEKAKGDMSARQLARMSKIINKINIAMSDMK